MTKEFELAVEDLYSTFSKYPFKSTIEGCPCCVSNSDKSTLHSKQLRDLEGDDISRYAFKAMTTWGDVNDFKHYLPRVFELAATRKLIVDTFVILGKLDFGKWNEWEKEEKASISRFLKAWWKFDINNASYFDSEVLIELNNRIQDLPSMLNDWDLSLVSQGFKNYVELIEFQYFDLKGKNKPLKNLNQSENKTLIKWIETHYSMLEEGFFKYDVEDKDFSERISNTLYMLERIK